MQYNNSTRLVCRIYAELIVVLYLKASKVIYVVIELQVVELVELENNTR